MPRALGLSQRTDVFTQIHRFGRALIERGSGERPNKGGVMEPYKAGLSGDYMDKRMHL